MRKRIIGGIFLPVFMAAVLLMGNVAYTGDDILVVGGLDADDPLATSDTEPRQVFMLEAEVGMDPNDEQAYAFKLRKNGSALETKRAIELSSFITLEEIKNEPAWSVAVGEIIGDSPGPEILIGTDGGGICTFNFHMTHWIDGWLDDSHPAKDVIVVDNYATEPGNEVMRLTDRASPGGPSWINTLNPSYGQFLWKVVSTQGLGNRFTEGAIADIDPIIDGLELATVDGIGYVNVWSYYYNYGFPVMRGIKVGGLVLACDVAELDADYVGLEIVAAENWYVIDVNDPNAVISAVTLFGRNPDNPYGDLDGLIILRNFRDIVGWTTGVRIGELDSSNSGLEIVAVVSSIPAVAWEGEVILFDADPNATDPNHISILAGTNQTMPGAIPAPLLSVALGEIDEASAGLEIIVGSQEGHVLVLNSDLTAILAQTQLFDAEGDPIPIRDIATIAATPDGDFNVDGIVDINDLADFTVEWLSTPYAVSAATPGSSPLGWWKFDGDANDSSGNGYHGTLVGDANIVTDPNRGLVLSLDGDGDSVSIPNEPAFDITSSLTVAAWIKVNAFDTDYAPIVEKSESWVLHRLYDTNNVSFGCAGIGFYWYGARSQYVGSTTGVNDGQWHHVAGVYDETKLEMYIYIDGVLEAISVTKSGETIITSDELVIIGNAWNGLIDDARIYDTALSQQEIIDLAERSAVLQPAIPPLLSDKLLYDDGEVNFRDYAVIANEWLHVADWY